MQVVFCRNVFGETSEARLGAGDTPNTVAVVLIIATRTWVDSRAIQVQGVAIVVNVRSRRPIVAAATSIVGGRSIEDAGVEEVVRIGSYGSCSSFSCSVCYAITIIAITISVILVWF